MKLIDLFIMRSNGEELPKHICINNESYHYDMHLCGSTKCFDYMDEDRDYLFVDYKWQNMLDNEIDIIREKETNDSVDAIKYYVENKIDDLKEIEVQDKTDYDHYYLVKDYETKYRLRKVDTEIISVINNLIKHVENLDNKEKDI